MKNLIVLTFCLSFFNSGFCQGIESNYVIVGPQNDCSTKKISRNVHTSSAYLKLDGTGNKKVKITTVQHRTYDLSRIYDQNGALIWEWKGESLSETWYTKEHFLTLSNNLIKVEFTQGYSDPFCNGYIKVEIIDQGNVQSNTVESSQVYNVSDQKTKEVQAISDTPLNISYEQYKKALDLYFFSFKGRLNISALVFDPMKLIICRGRVMFPLDNLELAKLDILMGNSSGGPAGYGEESAWRISSNQNLDKRIFLDVEKVIVAFNQEVNGQLAPECKECNDLIIEYYELFKNKTIIPDTEFQSLKLKTERCNAQRYSDLSRKSIKYLDILTGKESGGPSAYGHDSKYRIQQNSAKRVPTEILESSKFISKDILIKTKNGFGVSNVDGLVFIEPRYTKIELINFKGLYVYLATNKNDLIEILGYSGKKMIDFDVEKIKYNSSAEALFLFEGNKWWLINEETFTTKSTLFDEIIIIDDLLLVKQYDKFGFLNRDGEQLGTVKYDSVLSVAIGNFNSIIAVKLNNKWCLISHQRAKLKGALENQSFEYDSFEYLDSLNLIKVVTDNKIGFVKPSTRVLFPTTYIDFKYESQDRILLRSESGWGIFSTNYGSEITKSKYQNIEKFSNPNYYKVRSNEKYGLITKDGDEVLKPLYSKIFELQFDSEFQDSFLIVSNGNLYGSISIDIENQNKIHDIPVKFNSITDVSMEWEKNKNILYQKRIEEEKRMRIEQERLIQEQKIAKYKEEQNRLQQVRNSNPWGVALGDYYRGGYVIEIYADGSGVLIISKRQSGPIIESKQYCKDYFLESMSLARIEDIKRAMDLEVILPMENRDPVWVISNNATYSNFVTIGESSVIDYPTDYNSPRTAYLVQYGRVTSMWDDKEAIYQFACTRSLGKNE
jgi:hypothetical protein